MNRLWSRVGIRVASVGLLVAGTIGGVYLGQDRDGDQQQEPTASSQQLVVQADTTFDEMQLIRERHTQAAANRAFRNAASSSAASKIAASTQAAAGKAQASQKKAIDKKEADDKAAAEKKAAEEKSSSSSSSSSSNSGGSSGPSVGPIPASCDEYSGTRATGCALMLKAGFGIDQFPCLNKLFNRESGWNPSASNPSSGAYGIPQALPGSKMASVASDWRTNAATQIKWGLNYIEGRYNSPCGAWSHSESTGWY
ncbi:lytic transglycosylase domain-containing protein [Actinoplanes sp. TFC3]|uniref:aggregation-promoting factor C-terminal-like domain-containing protein n=1 Tax=Actinoplanes sp. TFC3 TaxID=1710355 RepID=UPI0008352CF7|nr:lytic transglycosylase domain-containing protein [Actinoplanes sp. TFC3]